MSQAEKLIVQDIPYKLELIKVYSRFAEAFIKEKNFERTSYYQQRYIELKDSIYNEELTTNLMKMEADYLEKENMVKIASQDQMMSLQKQAIKDQKLLNIFIGSIVIMLCLLAFVLIRSNRQKRRINQILDEKIKQRTRQLQESYDVMLSSNYERDFAARRTSAELKSFALSLKGLCSTAFHDLSDPMAVEYMNRVNVITDEVLATLGRFQNLPEIDGNKD